MRWPNTPGGHHTRQGPGVPGRGRPGDPVVGGKLGQGHELTRFLKNLLPPFFLPPPINHPARNQPWAVQVGLGAQNSPSGWRWRRTPRLGQVKAERTGLQSCILALLQDLGDQLHSSSSMSYPLFGGWHSGFLLPALLPPSLCQRACPPSAVWGLAPKGWENAEGGSAKGVVPLRAGGRLGGHRPRPLAVPPSRKPVLRARASCVLVTAPSPGEGGAPSPKPPPSIASLPRIPPALGVSAPQRKQPGGHGFIQPM